MEIGVKIKELRLKKQLTQEELADRCELTKGYISQLENDLTSPSIATLKDILQTLGVTLTDFFDDDDEAQLVFGSEAYFAKSDEGTVTTWLVPTSQKNAMEPIKVELSPGASTARDLPHEGEEFGYVLSGEIVLHYGKRAEKVRSGESFYFTADKAHYIENAGKEKAIAVWLSCPPNF